MSLIDGSINLHRIVITVILYVGINGISLADAVLDEKNKDGNCWSNAGSRYSIDPWLLYAIAEQESSHNPMAININDNPKRPSRDVGIMQINSVWFPQLEKFGISESHLFDPCININVGAWVLSQKIRVFGNTWRAVGAYNAGTRDTEIQESRRIAYADKVYARYVRLTGSWRVSGSASSEGVTK